MVLSPSAGHTILLVTSTHTIVPNLRRLPYDPIKDCNSKAVALHFGILLDRH